MKNAADNALLAAKISLENVKGDIVSQTLDKLSGFGGKKSKKNAWGCNNAMSDSYDFNKSVLSAVYEGKGTLIDSNR